MEVSPARHIPNTQYNEVPPGATQGGFREGERDLGPCISDVDPVTAT